MPLLSSTREFVEPDEDAVAREITGVVLEWNGMLIQAFKVCLDHHALCHVSGRHISCTSECRIDKWPNLSK